MATAAPSDPYTCTIARSTIMANTDYSVTSNGVHELYYTEAFMYSSSSSPTTGSTSSSPLTTGATSSCYLQQEEQLNSGTHW